MPANIAWCASSLNVDTLTPSLPSPASEELPRPGSVTAIAPCLVSSSSSSRRQPRRRAVTSPLFTRFVGTLPYSMPSGCTVAAITSEFDERGWSVSKREAAASERGRSARAEGSGEAHSVVVAVRPYVHRVRSHTRRRPSAAGILPARHLATTSSRRKKAAPVAQSGGAGWRQLSGFSQPLTARHVATRHRHGEEEL